jgi:hypothetical protein
LLKPDFYTIFVVQILFGRMENTKLIQVTNQKALMNTLRQCVKIRRNRKIKTPDAIIAASAIVHNLILITSDSDFNNIQKLKIGNPGRGGAVGNFVVLVPVVSGLLHQTAFNHKTKTSFCIPAMAVLGKPSGKAERQTADYKHL